MDDTEVPIPIKCPTCGNSAATDYPVVVLIAALLVWKQMRLYSRCHEAAWDASAADLGAIREHLGESWIESQRQRLAAQKHLLLSRLLANGTVPFSRSIAKTRNRADTSI